MTEQAPPSGTPAIVSRAASQDSAARAGRSRGAAQPSPRGGDTADVIVVGAGPAGSALAFYLATAGLDVLVLEKTHFPREKVCGDGLTPRAVKALTGLGVPIPEDDGWLRNKGLRIIGGGGRIEVPWPDISSYPGFGLVRNRLDFDEILARHAQKAGARLLEGTNVTGPILDDRTGRIVGVTARQVPDRPVVASTAEGAGRAAASGQAAQREFRARLVVAADGNSSRLSVSMGLRKRDDRPLGVAVRTYYTSPRHDDDYLEAWLDLWDGSSLLPGYGWIFGMGDGTSNVGLGLLNTSSAFGNIDYKDLLKRWLGAMPTEWGFAEENRTEPVRGAIAARVIVQALARPTAASAELVLQTYPRALKDAYGGYYTLGRTFVKLIGRPSFMKFATRHGVKRPAVMRFTMKLLGNLTETSGGDAMDRMLNALSKMTPAA